MLATRFFCPSTSKILSNQNRFVAHLLLALSNSPYPRGYVEPFFLKRTYGEYKKTGRQIALSARLLSYGEWENRFLIYLFIFIEIKNIRNFYTNVRTNKPELLPEFWSVCLLFKVLRTLSLAASNRACYVGNKN